MKIRTKLSLTFLLVSILPMVVAVYLAITVNIRLLQVGGYNQLKSAIPFVEQSQQRYLTRTGYAAKQIADNPRIIQAIINKDTKTFQSEIQRVIEQVGVHEVVYLNPTELQKQFIPKGKKIQQVANPVWQGYLPPEIEPHRGLMVVTIYKIVNQRKILGGIRVGYQFEKNIAEGITAATGLNAAIFPKESATLKKLATTQLRTQLFKQGQQYYANDILISNLHYQALFIPLKSLRDEVTAVVFLGIPQQPVEEIWRKYRNTFYLVTILFGSLFAMIMAYWLAGNIAKPIRQLASGAEQIAAGNLDWRIAVKSRGELGELAESFNHMAEKLLQNRQVEAQLRLKDKLAALGQLSAGVAHEVGNPLSSIKVSAELIQRKFSNGTQEYKQSQYIIDEVDRLNTLITDFLAFAKPREPNITQTKIEPIVERTLALAHSQLTRKPYVLDWQNQTGPEDYVAVDEYQIQQVFLNLVLNACQAMANGGKLLLTAFKHSSEPMLGVSFTDEGSGIPEEVRAKIFDPFFTTKEAGTGLGLAIAHQIIEAHGGKIELKSELNKGTTFTVYLPLVKRK
ncbi:MAG: ATP-binding protein [bacterium]|nr:ATP-binding protein [bacterium]